MDAGWSSEQYDITRLLREISSAAHRNTSISLCECGGVINSIADHCDTQSLLLERANMGKFAGRI